MNTLPLLGPADPDAVMAYTEGEPYTRAQFLAQVIALANELPDRPAALNLVRDRYHFLERAFHTYMTFLRARLLMTRERAIIAR